MNFYNCNYGIYYNTTHLFLIGGFQIGKVIKNMEICLLIILSCWCTA